jgi:hypothetical protein
MTTRQEGKLAAKITSQVPGVSKIITAYWYIEPNRAKVVNS